MNHTPLAQGTDPAESIEVLQVERSKHQDASLKGKAVEHLVAATCILISDLKLNVSTSFVDDEGVDLVFHRRGRAATLAIQVKSRFSSASTLKRGRFLADVRSQTFEPRPDLHILFVYVDEAKGDYGPVWLVPSKVFAARTHKNSKGKHRFSASTSPSSEDQWAEWRMTKQQLVNRLLDVLETLEQVVE